MVKALEPRFDIVAPHSAAWPRNSEGCVAVFPDGRWLLTWTGFYGGFRDPSPAHIMGRWSDDKGETWTEPSILLKNDGKCNVIGVSVTVFSDGTVGWVHARTDDESCFLSWPFFRKSADGGKTFGPHRVMVPMDTWHGFSVNGVLRQLSTGRILRPVQWNTTPPMVVGESFVQAAYSDDMGESWKLSRNTVAVRGTPERGGPNPSGAEEPAAFERKDGTIMFLMRTHMGTIFAAESADGGETLSESYDTGLECPAAPSSVGRIPATGDVLLVWNRARPDHLGSGEPRTPLATAISRDEGRTWGHFKLLETDTSRNYMYPALSFDGDTALVLYSQGSLSSVQQWSSNWHNTSLKLARVPYQWFYQ